MRGENIGKCRNCGKRIRFIRLKSGKTMPVDETIVTYKKEQGGKDRIVLTTGEVVVCVSGVSGEEADGYGYISHFASCEARRKR